MRITQVESVKITSDEVIFIITVPIREDVNKIVPISISTELLKNIAEFLKLE